MHKIYSDESGYTGDDLMHASQPFFVYSFLLMNLDNEAEIEREVPKIIDSIFKKDKPKEVKSLRLKGTTKGKKAISEICGLLSSLKVPAHYSIVEKRFQICAMVVETFFDPQHHPESPPEWEAAGWRKQIANFVYNISSEELLRDFLEAVKRDDEDAVRKSGERFSLLLTMHPDGKANHAGALLRRGLSNFYRFGKRVEDTPRYAESPSSSVVALMPILEHINHFLYAKKLTAELVCDETKQYGKVLDWIFLQAQNPEFVSEISSEFGYSRPLDRITKRTEINVSGDNAMIQCADVFAGLLNHRMMEHKAQQKPDPELGMAWEKIQPSIKAAEPAQFKMISERLGNVP